MSSTDINVENGTTATTAKATSTNGGVLSSQVNMNNIQYTPKL